VGFKELGAVSGLCYVETCSRICCADQRLLCLMAWHRNARCPPVLIDACLSNYTLDAVAIQQCLAERLKNYGAHTLLIVKGMVSV